MSSVQAKEPIEGARDAVASLDGGEGYAFRVPSGRVEIELDHGTADER